MDLQKPKQKREKKPYFKINLLTLQKLNIMNWINTAENLGITLISFSIGVGMGAFVTFKITDVVINSNQKVLIEAIQKPSVSNSSNYDIKNKRGTIDLKDGKKTAVKDTTDNIVIRPHKKHKLWKRND